MSELYDFLYLDTAKLYSFLSQIQGGLVSEINETIKRNSGMDGNAQFGIPPLVAQIGGSKVNESERQQTIQLTPPAYFSVFYQHLKARHEIKDITAADIQIRNELKVGEFVEMGGDAEPPVIEHWITRLRMWVELFERNLNLFTGQLQSKDRNQRQRVQSLSKRQIGQFREMVNFIEDYTKIARKDSGKQYIRVTHNRQAFAIWLGLLPDFVSAPLPGVLPARVHIVGRVERLLVEGETYKIVDFSQFNQPDTMNTLLDALSGLGPIIGQPPLKETDLQAPYPDVFISPIAIYR